MPNLLMLLNDLVLYNAKGTQLKLQKFESKIKVWLIVVDYTETLLEVSAKKFWGEKGRWLIITFVQIIKTVLRLLLVHVCKEHITKSPPIQPFNRDKLNDHNEKNNKNEGFILKRSGTVVRSIRSSSDVQYRTWEPLTPVDNNYNFSNSSKKKILFAESLYILKPLIHLGSISLTGEKQWPPWFLSLTIDLISLKILDNESRSQPVKVEDQRELFRRRLTLLLYILRSPFYDKYSKFRILAILNVLSTRVPLARLLTEPLKKYLPHWQSMYFYMWSC